MTNESALIIMQGVVDHYSMNVAQREAWQTLKTAVLAQQTTNSAMDEICPSCGSKVVIITTQPGFQCTNVDCQRAGKLHQ
jgi:Zn finger protein HypA/HybF involved in hydrogenase expression